MYRSNPGDSRCHYQLLLCSASAATELTCRSSRNTSSTRWTVNTVYIAHDTIKAYSEGLWVQHFLYPAEKFTRTPHPTPAQKPTKPATDDDTRRRLRSASSHKLIVRRSRLTTAGDRAFGVAPPPPPMEQSPYWRHLCIIFATFQETSENLNPSTAAIVRITFTNFVTCSWSVSLTSG